MLNYSVPVTIREARIKIQTELSAKGSYNSKLCNTRQKQPTERRDFEKTRILIYEVWLQGKLNNLTQNLYIQQKTQERWELRSAETFFQMPKYVEKSLNCRNTTNFSDHNFERYDYVISELQFRFIYLLVCH